MTGDWVRGLIAYLLLSLGSLVIFLLLYSRPLHADVTLQGLDAVMQIASHINTLLIVFYVAVAVLFVGDGLGAVSNRTGLWPGMAVSQLVDLPTLSSSRCCGSC